MKAFVIYLPTREHSVQHSQYMIDTLRSYNIDAELFEGTPGDRALALVEKSQKTLYPYSIKNRVLDEHDVRNLIRPELYDDFIQRHKFEIIERQPIGEKDKGKLSRPGVIGCFYSHFNLWNKCAELNEPIMIFEDDVKFYRGWHLVEWDDVLILSLGKSSYMSDPQKTYLENPSGVARAHKWQNFSMPGASGYAIKPDAARALIKFYRPYWYPADNAINQFVCNLQISTYLMGRNTLPEEGNISMTKSNDWVQR